jgi:hypothetical protein
MPEFPWGSYRGTSAPAVPDTNLSMYIDDLERDRSRLVARRRLNPMLTAA